MLMLRRRLVSAVSRQEETLSRFDDHLRRISTALFGAGMVAVLLVANSQLVHPQYLNRLALNCLVLTAGVSVVVILLFPWRRYNRNLFVVAPLDGLCLITLAVYFSGGWYSPFFPFYSFVAVFCAIYFSAQIAALTVILTVLISLSPQLYAPDTTGLAEHLSVRVPTYLALALVSWYMAREVGRRERLRGDYEHKLQQMQALKDHFQRASLTDLLTGLYNRRGFEEKLREEFKRARRSEEVGFTVILFDLDNFKQINDEYGHQTGDEGLKLVAEALRLSSRETDVLARYGGEEFTVVLPDTPPRGARTFFDRTREAVAKRSEERLGFGLRISAGAASFPADAKHPDGLLEAADTALYQAKGRGKDQFVHLSA
jgi:diguanylate cyclase (GGDEF)-like protein